MTNFSISPSADEATHRFPSLASLRVFHSELLKHHREIGNTPELLSEVEEFICRGRETGALLDTDEDRWASQSLLDYWTAILYRADREPPDATLVEFDPELAPELDDMLCPYLGLEAFKERNHKLFYGRQYLLEKLVDHLRKSRLLAVVGSSGSGKSSLVLGGLMPSLKAGALLSSENWHYFSPMVPGANPLANLARIIKASGVSTEQVQSEVENLQLDPKYLLKICSDLYNKPCLLVVDQLEEMFTLCRDDNVRQAFIDNLINLIQSSEVRHTVILTMRTDFESQVARVAVFKSLFEQAQVRVTAMDASELRDAIEKPAELVGLKFEEGLIDTLLHDVLGEPAALPLLQFTLLKLWDNRERNRVTWETYKRLGGGRQALAHSADEFYDQLIPEEQVTVKRILLRMVRPTEGLEITSNRIQRKTLYQTGEASDRVSRVLDRLIQARLVRLTEAETPDDVQIEVAHEALVRNWPRLVNWLEDERVNIRQRLRLTIAAEEWKARREDRSALLRGALLEDAQKYEDLSDLEKDFILRSRKAEFNNRRLIFASVTGAFLALAGLTIFYQWQSSERRRIEQTAIAAKNLLSVDPLQGMVSVISAVGQRRSPFLNFPNQSFPQSILDSLFSAVEISREKNRIDSHQGYVTSVVISTDGQTIVSGGSDGTVRLWSRNGQPVRQPFQGHHGSIRSVAISTDGQTIVSGGSDGTVRLWNRNGQPVGQPFQGHQGDVYSVAISTDRQTIVSGGSDGTVRLWSRNGQPVLQPFQGHQGDVYSVAISTDRQTIVSGGDDGIVRLWSRNGQPVGQPFQGHQGDVYSVAISTDRQTIVSGGDDGIVRLWSRNGQPVGQPFQGHYGSIRSVAISTDGQTIVSGGSDGTVRLWSRNGQPVGQPFQGHQGDVYSVAISTDGQTIVSGGSDGTVRLWSRNGQPVPQPFQGHHGSIRSVAISTDGQTIVSGGSDGTVRLWSRNGQPVPQPFQGHHGSIRSVAISTDEQTIVSGGSDGTVRLWSRNGQPVGQPFQGHQGDVYSVAISTDGQTIVSGGDDGTVRLWNRNGQPVRQPFQGHHGDVRSVAISTDEQTIVSGGDDGTVRLWNRNGQPVRQPFQGHHGDVRSVAISTDEQTIVSGGDDGTVRLWSRNGQPVRQPFQGHQGPVYSVAISTDEQTIVSGGDDGTVRLWSRNGQPVPQRFQGHHGSVYSVVISIDGQTIVSGGFDGTVRLWDIKLDTWLKAACERLRDHPVFKKPESADERQAKVTCEPYL